MNALNDQETKERVEMVNFFKENERVREACYYMERSFREVEDAICEQANKIDKLKKENAKLKRENEQLKAGTGADMTKPQPCTKFRDADTVEWIAKLSEETDKVLQEAYIISQHKQSNKEFPCEAMNEVIQGARERLALELTDVIHVCVSWLDAECWDEEARGELHRRVNEKNRERGYF